MTFKKTKKNKKLFYQMTVDEALFNLETNKEKGLTHAEYIKRQKKYGLNELKEGKRRSMFSRFFDQFKDLLIILLIVAGGLAYYLDDFRGGTILFIIVFVNAVIGFYQEFKAEKILDSLKSIIKSKAIVVRNGEKIEIEQKNLVPGDLVYLEEGNSIPADIRLIETMGFTTNDFILTGESIPQEKFADLLINKKTTITNQDNLVFTGVTVATGNAYGIVFQTGMNTAIGRIAKTSESISHDLSPLQKEIAVLAKTLTKIAGVIALVLFFANFILNVNSGDSIKVTIELSLLFAISVAAACVPQGLPAQISVALSLGVGRLASKKGIVKKLSAVETLGSTTVICTDKTGTITKNEMTITHCYSNGRIFEVTGSGYRPNGSILEDGKKVNKKELFNLKQFFQDGFLASNGRTQAPNKDHKDWYAIGDPTEAAFTPLAIKANLKPSYLDRHFPIHIELPFDSDRKRMTIIRRHKGKIIGYMKGGLESVLASCSHFQENGDIVPLTTEIRKQILKEGAYFATQALRVIALAYRDFPKAMKDFSIKSTEKQFIFSGFVAMIDPPKPGVKQAIKKAYDAHIRVMMITGDNAITAKAIADKIGMKSDVGELSVYTGDNIKAMKDAELLNILKLKSVIFSRVSTNDKFRIVSLLKKDGEVVAVTGDGVNDTLSLKKSDIGVAMGKVGSEVAKESAEIILLDDNFRTLTSAIHEGRTIFHNLKKTILSSITSNNGELICVLLGFGGMALGLPAPITAVQILAIDLVGEMLPLTALTFDPPEDHIMRKPPRNLGDHIINKSNLITLIFYGFWMGLAGFFSFILVYRITGSIEESRAAAYVSIIFCQFINILSRRTDRTIFTKYLFSNLQLWSSFLISIVAIIILVYVPLVSIWLGFDAISFSNWLYPLIGAVVFLFWHEVRKIMFN